MEDLDDCDPETAAAKQRFKDIFGALDYDKISQVYDRFKKIRDILQSANLSDRFWYTDEKIQMEFEGRAENLGTDIILGPIFPMGDDLTSYDSSAAIILHEIAHKADLELKGDDWKREVPGYQNDWSGDTKLEAFTEWASMHSQKAFNEADAYKFYAGTAYNASLPPPPPPGKPSWWEERQVDSYQIYESVFNKLNAVHDFFFGKKK